MPSTLRIVLSVFLLCASAASAPGAAPPPASTLPKPANLRPGDPAPEFKVEKFIKGQPFTRFERGKVYVVEFWATSCGPCVQTIPHLTQLQKKFADKVTICGVSIWEEPVITPATLARVETYVERKGDDMAYTVAYDGAAKHMETLWMQRSGIPGIPCAFIIDREGVIAWIGGSMGVEPVLEEVVAGTWDLQKGPERLRAGAKAFKDAAAKYKESLAAGDAAWAEAARAYPTMSHSRTADRFGALLQGNHDGAAFALGRTIVEEGKARRDPSAMQNMMGHMAAHPRRADAAYKALFLSAGQTAFDLSDPREAGPHLVLARAYFAAGDVPKGRAAAAKAVELSDPAVRAIMEKMARETEARFSP